MSCMPHPCHVQVTPPAFLEEQPVQFISNRPSFRGPAPSSPAPPAAATAAAPARNGGRGVGANSSASAAGAGGGGRRAGNGKGRRGGRRGGNGDSNGRGGAGGSGAGGDGGGGGVEAGPKDGETGTELGVLATLAAQRDYDFTLAGILKSAESSGYRIVDPQVCVVGCCYVVVAVAVVCVSDRRGCPTRGLDAYGML